jgi:hypothetical protein
VFFKDGTYRSYVLIASSTARDVCEMIQQKFPAERLDDHCLFYVKVTSLPFYLIFLLLYFILKNENEK